MFRGADEIGDRDAWYFHRILEGEEKARVRNFVRLLAEDVDAVEEHFATLDCVVFVTGHDFSERALTGAIGAHQCVHLAFRNREIESLKDGLPINGNMEIFDFERVVHFSKLR